VKELHIHNVPENWNDRRYVKVESLSATQLKEELLNRGHSTKGKKCQLLARLVETIGTGSRVSV